jgi:hypothetical protein
MMDVPWIDVVLSLAVGVALAAAAGMRVFLPLLVLGGAARFGWLPLTSGFEWLSSTGGLSALTAAVVLEVGAYYMPWVDNALDVIAAPLAVASGALAVAAVTTELPPEIRWLLAVVAGGGTAGVVQGLTSITRLKSTATTGGLANPVVATVELFGSLVTSVIAVIVPVVALALVIGLIVTIRKIGVRFRRRTSAA